MPRNVERAVAVTADRGHLFELIIVHQIGPGEVTEIEQVAVLVGRITINGVGPDIDNLGEASGGQGLAHAPIFVDYTSMVQPPRGGNIGGIDAHAKNDIAAAAPPFAANVAAPTAIEPVAISPKACCFKDAGNGRWRPAARCDAHPSTLVNECFPQVPRGFSRTG
jgi:hypothetical protein